MAWMFVVSPPVVYGSNVVLRQQVDALGVILNVIVGDC